MAGLAVVSDLVSEKPDDEADDGIAFPLREWARAALPKLSPGAGLLLMYLADLIASRPLPNANAEFWGKWETIEGELGKPARSIRYWRAELRRAGILLPDAEPHFAGRRRIRWRLFAAKVDAVLIANGKPPGREVVK